MPSAWALLNYDGTRNQVFVFGDVTFGYSSNIYSRNGGAGDYSWRTSVGTELKRRAGIIAVNARLVFDREQFQNITTESSWNPSINLELNKTIGRTTGALTFSAYRVSRADGALNQRTTSTNMPLGLSIKYPVNDKLYLTSQTGYLSRSYPGTSGFSTYTDYSQSLDAFYVFNSKFDLLFGYRYRHSQAGNFSNTDDHNFSVGATGGILPKLNGTIRLGYQVRQEHKTNELFQHISASVSLAWNATRKFTMTGQVGRDFSTTATGVDVDNLSSSLRAVYVFTRRWQADASVGYGRNIFLGKLVPYRRDDYFTWDVGGTFIWNEHLRVSASYEYYKNWSTLAFSDYERHGYSLHLASRW